MSSDVLRFLAPGPWITRDLKPCVLAEDYDALAAEFAEYRKSAEARIEQLQDEFAQAELDRDKYARDANRFWAALAEARQLLGVYRVQRDHAEADLMRALKCDKATDKQE
jgi:hypothetical protein